MDLKNYCLNLVKVNTIADEHRERIHDYYQLMLGANYHDNNSELAMNYFNTLLLGGYLIDIRDEKIEKILS